MSYNIGQLRRNEISSYSIDLSYDLGDIVNSNSIIDFYDACVYLYGENTLSSLYSYYLKFEVKQRVDSMQDFSVMLYNDNLEGDNSLSVRTLSVKQGNESTVFELIFTPNSNYNKIVFELKRLALDFSLTNEDGRSGRIMDVEILNLYIVNNVMNYLSSTFDGLTELKKIGLQAQPGFLFVLNGEEIRVGRTGIYELYNTNITISYIGFIIKDSAFTQDGKEFFILDFKY